MKERTQALLTSRLNAVFERYQRNQQTADLYEEVLSNLTASCDDLVAQGLDPEAAVDQSWAQMGDLGEVLNDISAPVRVEDPTSGTPTAPAPPTNRTDSAADSYAGSPSTGSAQPADPADDGEDDEEEGDDEDEDEEDTDEDSIGIHINLGKVNINLDKLDKMDFFDNPDWTEEAKTSLPLANELTFPAEGIERVLVAYNTDSIHTSASPDGLIHVREYMSNNDPAFRAHWELVDGELRIESGRRTKWFLTFAWSIRTRIEILIPRDFTKSLSVNSKAGSVRVAGLTGLNSVTASSMSGAARLEDVHGQNLTVSSMSGSAKLSQVSCAKLRASSMSGSVRLDDCSANELDASSISGSVKARALTAARATLRSTSGSVSVSESSITVLDAKSTSGTVTYETSGIGKDTRLTSSSGPVRLLVRPSDSFSFEARTGSGFIDISCERTQLKVYKKHQFVGFVGVPDSGSFVSLRSASGPVSIR